MTDKLLFRRDDLNFIDRGSSGVVRAEMFSRNQLGIRPIAIRKCRSALGRIDMLVEWPNRDIRPFFESVLID